MPHVLLVHDTRDFLLPLLSEDRRVRSAVADTVRIPRIESDLVEALQMWVTSPIPPEEISRVQDVLGCPDDDLRRLIGAALVHPAHYTTLGRLILDVGLPKQKALRTIRASGFTPPSQFIRVVRVLGAHRLLRSGVSVGHVASVMGYGRVNTMRQHFKQVLAQTPSGARGIPMRHLRISKARPGDTSTGLREFVDDGAERLADA